MLNFECRMSQSLFPFAVFRDAAVLMTLWARRPRSLRRSHGQGAGGAGGWVAALGASVGLAIGVNVGLGGEAGIEREGGDGEAEFPAGAQGGSAC